MVSRASDAITSRVGNAMNAAVGLARRSQDMGLTNWWGWYLIGIVDATADLVTDAVSDAAGWRETATVGTKDFIEDLVGDAD